MKMIHLNLSDVEAERVERTVRGLQKVGRSSIKKGDVHAALLLCAIDDEKFLARVRRVLTGGGK